MKYTIETGDLREPSSQGFGAALTFWLLSGMGLTVLAACVLMPEWRAYEELQLARQQAQYHSAQMAQSLQQEKRLLEAMHSDPAVIGRLARRELGFRSVEDQTVYVEKMEDSIEPVTNGFKAVPVEPPAIVMSVFSWLPAYDYSRVFCNSQTRQLLMVMSLMLIVVAFLLFGRPRTITQH